MRSTLVTLFLAVTIALILFCKIIKNNDQLKRWIRSLAGKWVCRPCDSQAECDEDPPEYCVWGEVRDACNRRMCAKGPGERCGGTLNILGQCGEGLMCKSDEICHGCSIQTMKCYND